MRLDVKDVDKMVSLSAILMSGKVCDLPTAFWLMRELVLFLKVANALNLYVDLYSGGILVNPEERRIVIYDTKWIGKRAKDDRNVEKYQWQFLVRICWNILGLDADFHMMRFRAEYRDYEFTSEPEADLFESVGTALWYESDNLKVLTKVVCALANRLAVDECEFALQEKPLVQKKKVESDEEDAEASTEETDDVEESEKSQEDAE